MSTTNSKGDNIPGSTDNVDNLSQKANLENVLTNLKIIAKVSPNDKLTVIDGILVIDQPQWGQGMVRWWRLDSRSNSMSEIEKLIEDSFTIIDNIYSSEVMINSGTDIKNNFYYKRTIPQTYFETENSHQLQTFSVELTNSVKGLQNLKLTYKSDISICSKIDVIIEKISIRISKINKLLTIKTSTPTSSLDSSK